MESTTANLTLTFMNFSWMGNFPRFGSKPYLKRMPKDIKAN